MNNFIAYVCDKKMNKQDYNTRVFYFQTNVTNKNANFIYMEHQITKECSLVTMVYQNPNDNDTLLIKTKLRFYPTMVLSKPFYNHERLLSEAIDWLHNGLDEDDSMTQYPLLKCEINLDSPAEIRKKFLFHDEEIFFAESEIQYLNELYSEDNIFTHFIHMDEDIINDYLDMIKNMWYRVYGL